MQLSDTEQEMLSGALGEPRRFALEQQMQVARFFDAEDFVEVSQVHLMADGEAVGNAGVDLLERFVSFGDAACRVKAPTVTDPRSVDPKQCKVLKQPDFSGGREDRIGDALAKMGIMLTQTCINYQTIVPPLKGEHIAFGDTGSVIYANSVCGARSNFEGGAAALWAALTGRVPRYGYHLDSVRAGTCVFELEVQPQGLTDWGVLGGLIGKKMGSYWQVPVVSGVEKAPTSDQVKHFGAALASYGSTPMFHIVGVTPEAPDLEAALQGKKLQPEIVGKAAFEAFYDSFNTEDETVDVVVFSAPQLSLFELEQAAELLNGKQVSEKTAFFITTSPENARAAERFGIADKITGSGARLIEGACFYQMYAREIGTANNWRRLATNSAKLANIISGYGYDPVLLPMERCIEAAIEGSLK